MLASNRVIWLDGATLKDLSAKLNNFYSDTQVVDYVHTTDKLYIGSDVPFNNRYFGLTVFNAVAATMTLEMWDGDEWVALVDIVDDTQATSGTPLSQNGNIQWSTEKNETWALEASTEDMTGSGLTTLKIYDMYWVRISFSATLTATMALEYIGHKFSKDEDLNGYYPDLNRAVVLSAFKAGKTAWTEQHILAGEEIFKDLRGKRELWAKSQIFQLEPFRDASVHKVAQIAYTAFGSEYDGRRDEAESRYRDALENAMSIGIDRNQDGHVTQGERQGMYSRIRRG